MTDTDIEPIPLLAGQGTVAVSLDAAIGLIRICPKGFLTPEQMDASFVALRAAITTLRERSRPVRVLVDTRHAPIQSAESADRLRIGTEGSYGPDDRIALIVGSMLARMQLRRVLDSRTHQLFLTEAEALAWLAPAD